MKRVILIVTIAAALAFAVFRIGPIAVAQSSSSAPSTQPREQALSMSDMMKMHEQMMTDMKAADARLDVLVMEMNAANGNAKITAMSAVITELGRQHKSMHARMGQMHQQMMSGRGMMMNR